MGTRGSVGVKMPLRTVLLVLIGVLCIWNAQAAPLLSVGRFGTNAIQGGLQSNILLDDHPDVLQCPSAALVNEMVTKNTTEPVVVQTGEEGGEPVLDISIPALLACLSSRRIDECAHLVSKLPVSGRVQVFEYDYDHQRVDVEGCLEAEVCHGGLPVLPEDRQSKPLAEDKPAEGHLGDLNILTPGHVCNGVLYLEPGHTTKMNMQTTLPLKLQFVTRYENVAVTLRVVKGGYLRLWDRDVGAQITFHGTQEQVRERLKTLALVSVQYFEGIIPIEVYIRPFESLQAVSPQILNIEVVGVPTIVPICTGTEEECQIHVIEGVVNIVPRATNLKFTTPDQRFSLCAKAGLPASQTWFDNSSPAIGFNTTSGCTLSTLTPTDVELLMEQIRYNVELETTNLNTKDTLTLSLFQSKLDQLGIATLEQVSSHGIPLAVYYTTACEGGACDIALVRLLIEQAKWASGEFKALVEAEIGAFKVVSEKEVTLNKKAATTATGIEAVIQFLSDSNSNAAQFMSNAEGLWLRAGVIRANAILSSSQSNPAAPNTPTAPNQPTAPRAPASPTTIFVPPPGTPSKPKSKSNAGKIVAIVVPIAGGILLLLIIGIILAKYLSSRRAKTSPRGQPAAYGYDPKAPSQVPQEWVFGQTPINTPVSGVYGVPPTPTGGPYLATGHPYMNPI